jgi:hypothetical protein
MQQRQPGKHHGGGSSASEGGDSTRRTRDGLNIPRPAPSLLRKVRDLRDRTNELRFAVAARLFVLYSCIHC